MRQPEWFARIGLAKRATVLVTVALLPLGMIAIWQTHRIIQDDRATSERALLAVTEKAAARERQVVERAIGAAAAIGNTARSLVDQPRMCADALRSFERASAVYSYAGFTSPDGDTACQSQPRSDMPDQERLADLMENERLGVFIKQPAGDTDRSVLVVATPTFEDGTYVGHLRLHIPHDGFKRNADQIDGERPLGLITFNRDGQILTSEVALADAGALLPGGIALADLRNDDPYSFVGMSSDGAPRTYAVVPLVPGVAYALGTWSTDVELLQSEASYWRTIVLAVLMWLASILVVFLIMQTLVISGVQRLKRQVAAFRDDRSLPVGDVASKGELFDLETDFRELTDTILHDEAQLVDAVHEKNVLLKEVHHRVKNNLQLINSIINMILRGSPSDETRMVVQRLQDRIMALASVHRSIYQAQSMDRVDAGEIVREIVNQGVAIGLPRDSDVDISLDLEPVVLYPDQAMPLSLLVSEATTNALKYIGGASPRIAVQLVGGQSDQNDTLNTVTLTVSNTVDDTVGSETGTGLGTQLVRAFAHQLDGQLETSTTDGLYRLSVTFDVAQFDPEDQDLPQAAE